MHTVALDMDGVMVDWSQRAVNAINEELGTNYLVSDIRHFNYAESFGKPARKIVYEKVLSDPHLYDDIDPEPGFEVALEELRSKYRVIAVTAPVVGHASSKLRWLHRHGFSHKDTFLCHDKKMVDFDVLVDDKLETFHELRERCILFFRPWNRSVFEDDATPIPFKALVVGWDEVPDTVDFFLGGSP